MGRKTDKGFSVGQSMSQLSMYNFVIRDRPIKMSSEIRNVIYMNKYISDKKNTVKYSCPEKEFYRKHPHSHPNYAPVFIPSSAAFKIENDKKGYIQVKYKWSRGKFMYEARWHTKTPNAPRNGQSWIITRKITGIGFGPNARNRISQVLVGSKWISEDLWRAAKTARAKGIATDTQNKLLDKGHHKPKRRKNNEEN